MAPFAGEIPMIFIKSNEAMASSASIDSSYGYGYEVYGHDLEVMSSNPG